MLLALFAQAAAAASPSTADLDFMTGEWRLEGAFNPGTAREEKEKGTRSCAFIMNRAYVRCDWKMKSERGRLRELASYHNYNHLYRRYEHLFIASSWPTKVIGSSALTKAGGRADMAIDIRFALPDGRTEHVRDMQSYTPDRFEALEQLRVMGGEEEAWRTNYRLVGTRIGG